MKRLYIALAALLVLAACGTYATSPAGPGTGTVSGDLSVGSSETEGCITVRYSGSARSMKLCSSATEDYIQHLGGGLKLKNENGDVYFHLNDDGNLMLGPGNIPTTNTAGYPAIGTMDGTPSGNANPSAGFASEVLDRTNKILYIEEPYSNTWLPFAPLPTLSGLSTGDLFYWDATTKALVRVAPGADGTVLTSTGAGAAPAFESAAGGGGDVSSWFTTELATALSNSGLTSSYRIKRWPFNSSATCIDYGQTASGSNGAVACATGGGLTMSTTAAAAAYEDLVDGTGFGSSQRPHLVASGATRWAFSCKVTPGTTTDTLLYMGLMNPSATLTWTNAIYTWYSGTQIFGRVTNTGGNTLATSTVAAAAGTAYTARFWRANTDAKFQVDAETAQTVARNIDANVGFHATIRNANSAAVNGTIHECFAIWE